jgi:enamine deaminase RidA (YjgF/YER057c/UK114 family)
MGRDLNGRGRGPIAALALAVALAGPPAASAQGLKEVPLPPSQNPTGADRPFSAAVWAGDTLYVSGWLDPDPKTHADTASQTRGVLEDMQKFLASQNLTLGDVAMVRVYLAADPAKGGEMDIPGFRAGYYPFFGTRDQPNKPACTMVQVVLPSGRRGALVEIDVVAARPKSQPST